MSNLRFSGKSKNKKFKSEDGITNTIDSQPESHPDTNIPSKEDELPHKTPSIKIEVIEPSYPQESKIQHKEVPPKEEPLRLFYSTNFFSGTPIPSVSIIVAANFEEARIILDNRLKSSGLKTKEQTCSS